MGIVQAMAKQEHPPLSLPARPRILVVTLRRLGDVLLTTPLIRSLRRTWPQATIDLLAFTGTTGIVEGNPDLDGVVTMSARPTAPETIRLAASLWRRYDLAVSTQGGDRPTLLACLAGRRRVGVLAPDAPRLGNAVKRRLLDRTVDAVPGIHRVELMLRLADATGAKRVPQVVLPAAAATVPIPGRDFAVIHAAPMFRYKQWTPQGWRDVAAALRQRGLEVVAIGGPDPRERCYLDDVWRGAVAIHQLPWPQNVALLSRARLYVGPDTSVSHLAAAAGCPSVVLFGPTDARVWGPWPADGLSSAWQAAGSMQNRGNVWLVQNPLPCMPCGLEGCERHLDSASACLNELPADRVIAAIDRALAAGRLPRVEAPSVVT